MRTLIQKIPYIYFAYTLGVIGLLLLIIGLIAGNDVTRSVGIALFSGAFVGAGFQFATSTDLGKVRGNVGDVMSLLRDVSQQAEVLSHDLRVARTAEREGVVALYSSRANDEFVKEVKERIKESVEIWIQGITTADFFGTGKVFYQEMRDYVRRGGHVNVLLLDGDSADFEERRQMTEPRTNDKMKSQLYIDHLQSMATLDEWKNAYGARVKVHLLRSQPPCWVLKNQQTALVQQYHNGFPAGGATGDDDLVIYPFSHDFPVLQFGENSPHFRSITSHLERTVEHQDRPRPRARSRK